MSPPSLWLKISQAETSIEQSLLQRWRGHVPPKCRLIFNGLHRVTYQEVELFVTSAVSTWKKSWFYVSRQAVEVRRNSKETRAL
jgi:hypothetical protein